MRQTEVVQCRWAKVGRSLVDVPSDVAGQALKPAHAFSKRLIAALQMLVDALDSALQRFQSKRKPGYRLSDLIVQIARDPLLDVLLRVRQSPQKIQTIRFGTFLRPNVSDDAIKGDGTLLVCIARSSAHMKPS